MKRLEPHDPELQPRDPVAWNVEQLRRLFPEAWADGRIDLDVLREFVGELAETAEEKYAVTWHGKRLARRAALTASAGTLLPVRAESKDWASTQNLIIEGENLEVLKLLQKSYADSVRLIYIDPPYNTGADVIYPDDYVDPISSYLELTGQTANGTRITTNAETSGRFHTNWLNMIYPRLKLAHALLADNGLLIVSISDVEQANLRRCLDEIFGEENFVEQFIWKKSYGGGAKERYAVTQHEYCIAYARNLESIPSLWLGADPETERRYYEHTDEHVETRGPFRLKPLEATKSMGARPNLNYPLIAPDGEEVWPKRQWWWSRERAERIQAEGGLHFMQGRGGWVVSYKQYLRSESGEKRGAKPFSIVDGAYTQRGTATIRELFDGELVFPFPKPVELIERFVEMATDSDSVVLDFFAGSGTTAHAVMSRNAADGGNRRFILVQLPEALDAEKTQQETAALFCDRIGKTRTIAELTKERVRRAGDQLRRDAPLVEMDTGFRVYRLATSSIKAWDSKPADLADALLAAVDNVNVARSDEDLLTELCLRLGLDLSEAVETRLIATKAVHGVGDGTLIACFDRSIGGSDVESLSRGILEWIEERSARDRVTCIFLDSAFTDDVAKTNLTASLSQGGITRVRSL